MLIMFKLKNCKYTLVWDYKHQSLVAYFLLMESVYYAILIIPNLHILPICAQLKFNPHIKFVRQELQFAISLLLQTYKNTILYCV